MNKIKTILARRNGKFTEEFELLEKEDNEIVAEAMLLAFGRANPAFASYVEELSVQKTAFKMFSPLEFMKRPRKQWLIKKLLGKNDLAMIFGSAGTGKTFLTLDMILSIVTGTKFAGRFRTADELNIVYCAGEGLSGLSGRLAAVFGKYELPPQNAKGRLIMVDNVPQLFDTMSDANAINFVLDISKEGVKLDLLIVDTLHTATSGMNENCAGDCGKAIMTLRYIQRELDCAVLLVHHTNKMGGYRGSSAFHAAMDMMIKVKSSDGLGLIECFKQKDAEAFKPLYFRLQPDTVSKSAYVEWVEKEIPLNDTNEKIKIAEEILTVLENNKCCNQTKIAEKIKNCSRNTVRQAIQQLVLEGVVTETKIGSSLVYDLPVKKV